MVTARSSITYSKECTQEFNIPDDVTINRFVDVDSNVETSGTLSDEQILEQNRLGRGQLQWRRWYRAPDFSTSAGIYPSATALVCYAVICQAILQTFTGVNKENSVLITNNKITRCDKIIGTKTNRKIRKYFTGLT